MKRQYRTPSRRDRISLADDLGTVTLKSLFVGAFGILDEIVRVDNNIFPANCHRLDSLHHF